MEDKKACAGYDQYEDKDPYEDIDQAIYDEKDDAQYEILYEGHYRDHKYMVVCDRELRSIGYATDFDQDLRGLAPDFSRFTYFFGVGSEAEAIKLARGHIDSILNKVEEVPVVTMGNNKEHEEITYAKRAMSWAVIKLTKSIEDLRELCKREDWDDELTYDMEEAKMKLGECLADITVWDEESFEKGSTRA